MNRRRVWIVEGKSNAIGSDWEPLCDAVFAYDTRAHVEADKYRSKYSRCEYRVRCYTPLLKEDPCPTK